MLRMSANTCDKLKERSLADRVADDGVMRTKEILSIVQQLCLRMSRSEEGQPELAAEPLSPDRLFLSAEGTLRWPSDAHPVLCHKAYNPPELYRHDRRTPEAQVFALGMLMLFLATGKERKSDISTLVSSRYLRSLIERCTAFDPSQRIKSPEALLEFIKYQKRALKPLLLTGAGVAAAVLFTMLIVMFWQKGHLQGSVNGNREGYRSGYGDGYAQGFSDAPGIGIREASLEEKNGNLRGSQALEHGAFAARSEKNLFFLMNGNLYQMDPNTMEIQFLTEAEAAYCLQYYDGWVYFCTEEKILRFHPITMKKEVFGDSRAGLFYLVDDAFYLYDIAGTSYLYRIQSDQRTVTQLNGEMQFKNLTIYDNKLYYIDPKQNNSIWRSDLDGSNTSLISSHAYSSLCLHDRKLYAGAENGLIRMDLNGGNPEILTRLPSYYLNVSDGGIFYVAGQGRTLEWMSLDGKTRFTLVSSRTGEFNPVGQWLIYRNEEDSHRLWRVRISGSDAERIQP